MKPPTEKQAVSEITELLADLFGSSPRAIRLQAGTSSSFDYSISLPGHRFLVEYKSSASAGSLAMAVERLKRYAEVHKAQGLPLVVVPFMGHVGQELCE